MFGGGNTTQGLEGVRRCSGVRISGWALSTLCSNNSSGSGFDFEIAMVRKKRHFTAL